MDHELIKVADDNNFQAVIAQGVTLVDFAAVWCGPCRMLAPILEEVAQALEGQAIVAKVDIDQSQATAAKFQVSAVPTVILFKDGQEVERVVGLQDADTLKDMVSAAATS